MNATRWIGMGFVGLFGLSLVGCLSSGSQFPFTSPAALAADITDQGSGHIVARAQRPEGGVSIKAAESLTPASPPIAAPPSLSPNANTEPLDRGATRVSIAARVNDRPIFEDEVLQMGAQDFMACAQLPDPDRTEEKHKIFSKVLDQIIDQEVMYQDAIKKLEKANARALDKLKEFVEHEFEKQLVRMRQRIPEDQLRVIEPVARRIMERNLISTEYARNRILAWVTSQVDLAVIQEYYDTHQKDFLSIDKVRWQDCFIEVGPKHPTVADAKRFAQQLLANCRTSDDFTSLLQHDDGDSKLRGGEGRGQRRGEISPPQLEEHLFRMRDGEVGPIVEMATGVHVFRLLKRDFAGQLPLDDATQKQIRRKLENQLADREYKRIVRDLRSRAIITIYANP